MVTLREAFATRLREARTAAGMTQEVAAKAAKIPPRTYSDYERGLRLPPLEAAVRLCVVFGCQLDALCTTSSS